MKSFDWNHGEWRNLYLTPNGLHMKLEAEERERKDPPPPPFA